jgi:RNA polymerase sigma-70 factor (ECF subfamily)
MAMSVADFSDVPLPRAEVAADAAAAACAFERLLTQMRDELLSHARFLAKDNAMADDLVQSVLERALRNRLRFSPGTNLRAWLHAILYNLFVDCRRSTSALCSLNFDPEWEPPRDMRGPLDVLTLNDVLDAVDRLDAPSSEIIRLVYLQRLPHLEVSRRLRIPRSTVATRAFRAKAKLRRALGVTHAHRVHVAND